MKIIWKALIGYGLVFWIALCIMDFLGLTNVHGYTKDPDELYYKQAAVQKIAKQQETHSTKSETSRLSFGWSMLAWNVITFLFSIAICSIGRTMAWTCWGLYRSYRNRIICSQINSPNQYARSSGSRIPVMVKPILRSSDTNITDGKTKSKLANENSCPDLLLKRSGSTLSNVTDVTTKSCRTIFRKDIYLCDNPGLSTEQQLRSQCQRLKEELHRLQTTSLKEHAALSRKLDAVTKDRKETSRQLATTQKENRAAKQQLEELLQEKSSLLKKLENATKEFKFNTKTKKFALAKLEEVTNNVEELRQQLEQVSRDKEILEKKLKLLETEYNKLHERYISSQQKLFTNQLANNENLPERDDSNDKDRRRYLESFNFMESNNNNIPPAIQQTAEVLASVSQTELDMKKIQEKIKQLEKNLENLNTSSNNYYGYTSSLEQIESEISLSAVENSTDSQNKIDEETGTTFSGFSSSNSPRQKYWSEKVAELIGKNKQFSKIQELACKMQHKARFLGNIRENIGSTEDISGSTDSDDAEPKRLVSSSVAFKNFLKGLNKLDATKKEFSSKTEVYF